MKITSHYKTLLLFLSIFSCYSLNAQVVQSKIIYKSFPISQNGDLRVVSKYGFIKCVNWNKDSIGVQAQVVVSTKDEFSCMELLASIAPQFQSVPSLLVVNTKFNVGNSSILKKYLKAPGLLDKNEIDVNYTIYLPSNVALDIENKFGDVLLEEHSASNKISLQYGDLRFQSLGEKSILNLRYGRMVGRSMARAKLNLKNYDVRLGNANQIDLSSSGSELKIKTLKSLFINSSRDQIEIEKLNSIKGFSKFSDLEFQHLSGTAELELENCQFLVEESVGFSLFEIDQNGSNLDIRVDRTSFKLNATMEKGRLSVPKTATNVSKVWIDESEDHRKINLTYGANPTSSININGKKGSVTIWD